MTFHQCEKLRASALVSEELKWRSLHAGSRKKDPLDGRVPSRLTPMSSSSRTSWVVRSSHGSPEAMTPLSDT